MSINQETFLPKMKISISTNPEKLDSNFIHQFLTESYWAKGRTLEEVRHSIRTSLNFGLFDGEKHIGYARVISDEVVFAYLMDVFIDKAYRGLGLSSVLMKAILEHPKVTNVKRVFLGTMDAHPIYKKFGFRELRHPERWMEKLK